MELFVCAITDILHVLTILMVCKAFFLFRRREFKQKYGTVIFTIFAVSIVSIVFFYFENDIIETIIYVLVMMCLVLMLYKENIKNIVIVTIWTIFAVSVFNIMATIFVDIFMQLFHLNVDIIYNNLVISFFSLALIYILCKVYKKNRTSTMQTVGFINLIVFTVLLAADFFVVSAIKIGVSMYEETARNLYLIAVIFVIIGIFIQLAAVIILFAQRNILKEKEQLADAYLAVQKNHYEYLETREKETKKFRHDLRNHMELISNLARHKEYDKIDEYLEQMNMKIDTFGNIVTVHNGMVDAIINQYYMKARQNGVNMKVEGKFPVDCSIEAYDLCTIFSNVLSNAYEAAMEAEDKYISLVCGYTERNIIIAVENSCRKETSNEGGFWRTKKDNADYHGYGLENIKDTVKKYDGVFDIEIIDNICMLKISFNHKEEPEGE